MSGLLGSMIAGGAGKAAEGRVKQIERQEQFNLENALLDARMDKEVRLKQMGYEMDDKRAADQNAKRAEYFNDVEETSTTPASTMQKYTDANGVEQTVKSGGEEIKTSRPATMADATERAIKSGDLESAEGLLKMTPKSEKSFESVKLDDGSVMSFDKSTGAGKIIQKGGGVTDVPKNEIDLAWRMAEGDPKKAAEILVQQKARVSAAGRAPDKLNIDEQEYNSYVKQKRDKGEKPMSLYQFNNWKAKERKGSEQLDTVTESTTKYDDEGNEVKKSRTSKVPNNKPKAVGALQKSKDGNYTFSR
jgi:hypothetical protein